MDETIRVLKTINKLSYLTEYELTKVSQLMVYNVERGASSVEAARMILRLKKEELQERLRDEVKDLPIDSDTTPKWRDFLIQLSDNIMNGDINTFLDWPVITQTMFVGNASYLDIERK